ncbi:unnamed protein product [Kuraishia capsulata CBS 1993]|uniref:Sm domain-containing protein n=1 Tax=Kuraishia capsulata CBS 1993 TaxID=1382522 RepID=W6MSR2_9ASCO|nr:uncharacterized protein KUCA_T00005742001 [Kuraishia capsulata CBS 1993]CDK29749.1 unnamed protein product [Kuraishia capsulata CBS 1993]
MAEPIDYISLPFRVTVVDGRVLEGRLLAIDDESNLLVTDVKEHTGEETRDLGLVSVPRKTIVKLEVEEKEYGDMLRWKQAQTLRSLKVSD